MPLFLMNVISKFHILIVFVHLALCYPDTILWLFISSFLSSAFLFLAVDLGNRRPCVGLGLKIEQLISAV